MLNSGPHRPLEETGIPWAVFRLRTDGSAGLDALLLGPVKSELVVLLSCGDYLILPVALDVIFGVRFSKSFFFIELNKELGDASFVGDGRC